MWEKIDDGTSRMKVPTGWIVRNFYKATVTTPYNGAVSITSSMVFVPDPKHDWKLQE